MALFIVNWVNSKLKLMINQRRLHETTTNIIYIFIFSIASKYDLETYSTSLEFAQVTHVIATQKPDDSWCFDTSVRQTTKSGSITQMAGRL